MIASSIRELLDLQREIHRRVDQGDYVIDVEELRQPIGLRSDVPSEPVHMRKIEV